MNLLLPNDRWVTAAFDVMKTFQHASGSKLNMEKTEGMYFGYQQGRTNGPVPIPWKTDGLEILGTRMNKTMEQDWETPIQKAEANLHLWSTRKLTIRGRALLAKTFGIASIIYLATCFPIPTHAADRLTKAIFSFLWCSGVEFVKRTTIQKPLDEGGLGIPNIKLLSAALKIKMALKTVTNDKESTWFLWTRYHIGATLATVTNKWASLRDNKTPNKLPPWYKEITDYVTQHKVRLAKLAESNAPIATKSLAHLGSAHEQPRAEPKWASLQITTETLHNAWTRVWHSLNTGQEQELRWRILHWSLPTKTQLHKWKNISANPQCPFFTLDETMEHALISCQRLQPLWAYVNLLLQKLGKAPVKNLPEAVLRTDDQLSEYLVTTTIFGIWQTRKRKIFDNTPTPDLIKQLKERIKQRIKIEQYTKRNNRVKTIWTQKGIFASFENNELKFNI